MKPFLQVQPLIEKGVKVLLWHRLDLISGQHIFGVEFTRYSTKQFASAVAFEIGRYFPFEIKFRTVKINFTRLFKSELIAEFTDTEIMDINIKIVDTIIKTLDKHKTKS